MGMAAAIPRGMPARAQAYGGFWIRFVAVIIDAIVLSFAAIPIWTVLGGMAALGSMGRIDPERLAGVMASSFGIFLPVFGAINWLYDALLTSSTWQGTLGKRVLGLQVTDDQGNQISFLRATGRHFAKFLSGFLFIGYIIAAFADRKKALHDFIAGTVVVRS
ncbi:MAG TPA: RDD family protein [Candidatus Angelobacter sp.]|nr:RDD family protein [Candidatus Angelobacter sp.]